MSNWPPNPDQKPTQPSAQPNAHLPAGQEWQLLEKVLMSSVEEQRRSRRWGIFFKLITLAYVLFLLVALGRGCSSGDQTQLGVAPSVAHLAIIDIQGEIGGDRGVHSDDVIESLNQAFEAETSKAIVLNINSP
ncbi:MAG: S49 family peptidase, partial [Moraxellaceae bacterium]